MRKCKILKIYLRQDTEFYLGNYENLKIILVIGTIQLINVYVMTQLINLRRNIF